MKPRFASIISRIMWLHALALAIAAVAMPLATYLLLSTTAIDLENHTLQNHAETIREHLDLDRNGQWRLSLPRDLQTFYLHEFDGFAYSIVDSSNRVLFSSLRGKPKILSGGDLANSPSYFHRQSAGGVYYGASFPVTRDGKTIRISIAQNLAHPDVIVDDIVTEFLIRVAWFTLPIMFLLLLTDIVIVRRALRPVDRASSMAQEIDPRRINLRLPTGDVPREILPLVVAINQALDRLEAGFRLQRDFTADAAHELRTPLAVLRARVDTFGDQEQIGALRNDVEVMSRIINELLEVAELETSSVSLKETIDLRSVCGDVVSTLTPLAAAGEKGIALVCGDDPVLIKGSASMLHQAIRNLAENALKHTPIGTVVEIQLDKEGTVRVVDEGPGVPELDRDLIFRRFWRRDRSRANGAGLGLSIVARIVEMHAGTIDVAGRPSGGAVFSMRLGS